MFSNHPKSKFWSDRNEKKPHEIALNTHEKFWFDCDKCGKKFDIQLNNINIGFWCPYCANNKLHFFIKSRL
jgi:DNA-directed RNA polymerase subunit RPC12/RpoP